jgi:hypothetical protein
MITFKLPSAITLIQNDLPPAIQKHVEALSAYGQSSVLNVGVIFANQALESDWPKAQIPSTDIKFKEHTINQKHSLDEVYQLAYTDGIVVLCSAIQLITKDIFDVVNEFSQWEKPLILFVGGFEYIGQTEDIIQSKIAEAVRIYPYTPVAVYAFGAPYPDEESVLDPLTVQLEKGMSALRPLKDQLRRMQYSHLLSRLEYQIGQYLQPHRAAISHKSEQIEKEIHNAIQIAKIQQTRDTVLSLVVRTFFDRWITILNDLKGKEAYRLFDISVENNYFDPVLFYQKLYASLLSYVKAKFEKIGIAGNELEPVKDQFSKQVVSFWDDHLQAWNKLLPINEQLLHLWTNKEEVQFFFNPLFQKIEDLMDDLRSAMNHKVDYQIHELFEEYDFSLKKALRRSYHNHATHSPENPDTSNQADHMIDDALETINITAGSSLPNIIEKIIQKLRQYLLVELDRLKRIALEKTAKLQQESILEFTTQINNQFQTEYQNYQKQTKDIVGFNSQNDGQ